MRFRANRQTESGQGDFARGRILGGIRTRHQDDPAATTVIACCIRAAIGCTSTVDCTQTGGGPTGTVSVHRAGSCQHFANRLSSAFSRRCRGRSRVRGKTAGQGPGAGFKSLSQGGDTGSNPVGAADKRAGRSTFWPRSVRRMFMPCQQTWPNRCRGQLSSQGQRGKDLALANGWESDLGATLGVARAIYGHLLCGDRPFWNAVGQIVLASPREALLALAVPV